MGGQERKGRSGATAKDVVALILATFQIVVPALGVAAAAALLGYALIRLWI